jgi:hypothetical protein
MEEKLLFIVVYQKTPPWHTMPGWHFGLSQPQANYWIHLLLPVLQRALADLGLAPECEASRVAESPLALEGASELAIDGSERRRQRPQDTVAQKEHYSGKKKAHTDKNILAQERRPGRCPPVYLGTGLPSPQCHRTPITSVR